MPFRLIYSSEATPGLAAAELEEMLAESRIRNQVYGITGVLLFVEGAFLQILEGEKDDVLGLMERIQRDPRHRGVKVFYEHEGATTIGAVLASIESNPGRLPVMVVNILKTLAAP